MQLSSFSHQSKSRCARVILSLQLVFATASPAFAWQEDALNTKTTNVTTPVESTVETQPKALAEAIPLTETKIVDTDVETKTVETKTVETPLATEAQPITSDATPGASNSSSSTIAQPETKSEPDLKTVVEENTVVKDSDISSLKIPQHETSLTPLLTPEKTEAELSFLEDGAKEEEEGIITIDSDESEEVQATIVYEEMPTDEGKTHIKAGAQFPVAMVSQLSSKTAKLGDNIQARLKYDIKIGDRHIAKKGCVVTGHIDYILPARSVMHSLVSPTRWYRNSGCIGIAFDEILNEKGEHIALNAKPARRARIVKNKAEGRLLGVNHDGQITGPWGQQLRYKAVRVGLNAAMAPAGAFTFGAMPVALGVMGAINPSFAFMKPVGTNVRHRRIKGFAWGFLSGIPGSWIIEDTVTKGQEAIIKPGDEFLVELQKEFTGEAMTEAELMPGATSKVRGEVDRKGKPKK